jgi:hypothetical protein
MLQPTIFAENFEQVRRRKLLPAWMKVYMWVGMGAGLFILGSLIMVMIREHQQTFLGDPILNFRVYNDPAYITGMFFGLAIVVKYHLVWFEWRWAIRMSWLIQGIGTVLLILMPGLYAWPFIISVFAGNGIPCWFVFYKIRYDWELVRHK